MFETNFPGRNTI